MIAVALGALVTLAACGGALGAVTPTTSTTATTAPDPGAAAPLPSFYRSPSPLAAAPPGSVIRTEPMTVGAGLPSGTRAYRVLYHSRSIVGADLAVSGVVVVPPGAPPPGGFPVVGFAHGTTGLADRCAPSLVGAEAIPDLTALIADRTIVAATDYQGLGTAGPHPYLVGQSEGQSVLDGVRAARSLVGPAASNTVVLLGYSQGGQSALFAGQIAPAYAPELFIAGVAAVAPVSSLGALLPDRPAAAVDGDAGFAAMALVAWSATYGNIDLGRALTPVGLGDTVVVVTGCSGAVEDRFDTVPADRLFRSGWLHQAGIELDAAANRPGRQPTAAPVLVVQGTADTLVREADTTRLVDQQLCDQEHDSVDYRPIAGAGHGTVMAASAPLVAAWISARVAGHPPTDTCGGRPH